MENKNLSQNSSSIATIAMDKNQNSHPPDLVALPEQAKVIPKMLIQRAIPRGRSRFKKSCGGEPQIRTSSKQITNYIGSSSKP